MNQQPTANATRLCVRPPERKVGQQQRLSPRNTAQSLDEGSLLCSRKNWRSAKAAPASSAAIGASTDSGGSGAERLAPAASSAGTSW